MLRAPLRLRTCEPWWHAGNGWSKSPLGYFEFAEILTAGGYNRAFKHCWLSDKVMLRRYLSPFSSKVFVFLLIFLALEVLPLPGLYLTFLGGSLFAGLLVHLLLASLLVEALIGRIPRAFVLIPIIAYGAYYAAYFREGSQVAQVTEKLRTTNPGKIYDFDPAANSLVMDRGQEFVETHDVPVVYEPNRNFPEGYLSERLITRVQCRGIKKDTQNRVSTLGVHFNDIFQQNICLLRFPERPTNKAVKVTLVGDPQLWARDGDIRQQTTEISVDDKTVGSFTRAFIWRLPALPVLAIGCMLIDQPPAWKCLAAFDRRLMTLDGIPDNVDRVKFDEPTSVMLGIRKYVAADLANFSGFESNLRALDSVHQEPEKVENNVFAILDAIIDGQNPKTPFNLGYSLAANLDRLTPHADGMARRFVALLHGDTRTIPNWREQMEALATAIGALPHEAFVSVSGPLFEVVKEDPDRAMHKYPMIYVRMGEAGTAMLSFYRDQVMAKQIRGWERMFPVLALCRIGEADTDLIEELKRRYNSVDLQGGSDPVNYKTALFVTLLRLGQDFFLREDHPNDGARDQWYADVLAGKGLTKIGPNNCMPEEWPLTIYATREVASWLKWSRNGWDVRNN
jgi:hypothetical protein